MEERELIWIARERRIKRELWNLYEGGHVANGIDRESIRCVECSIGRIGRKGTRPDEIVVPYRRIESPSQQPSPSCVLPWISRDIAGSVQHIEKQIDGPASCSLRVHKGDEFRDSSRGTNQTKNNTNHARDIKQKPKQHKKIGHPPSSSAISLRWSSIHNKKNLRSKIPTEMDKRSHDESNFSPQTQWQKMTSE
jgi:hypothetical protein